MNEDGRQETQDRDDRDLDLVTVIETSNAADLAVAESLLQDAGIPYLARGAMIQDLFGLGRLTAVNPITGPVAIQVNRPDEEGARRALARLTEADD